MFSCATLRVQTLQFADHRLAELHCFEFGTLHFGLGHRNANLGHHFLVRELVEFLLRGVLAHFNRRLVDGHLRNGIRPLRQHEALVRLEVPNVVRWQEPGFLVKLILYGCPQ